MVLDHDHIPHTIAFLRVNDLFLFIITDKTRTKGRGRDWKSEGVGVMKDNEVKIETEVSHTLGGSIK